MAAALAESEDVRERLGRPLTETESDRVDGLLDEASLLVEAWIGCSPDPVPDAVRVTVSRMAARALQAAESGAPTDGANSVAATSLSFSHTRNYPSAVSQGGVWLSRQDRIMLRSYRRSGYAINVPTS